jgi:SSS family solute:Na+ symporter
VLQFFLIVAGFVPLVLIGLKDVGGWSGLTARLATESVSRGFDPGAMTESWRHMGSPASNPMGVEWFGLVMGLGFVLSFGYWCTDFLVVQRAMAADSMNAARRTPLIAGAAEDGVPVPRHPAGHDRHLGGGAVGDRARARKRRDVSARDQRSGGQCRRRSRCFSAA